jgi:CheY-like chemotaxis protein
MAEQVRPTVLVVDDDEFQHKMVARILETENCRLVFVASGAEALKILGTVQPDLILMDVQMPGMDGIETTRRLKAVPRLAKVPVVMITGQSAGTVVVDSLKAGAADFVVKPFEREKLISKVARWSRPTG